MGKIIYGVLAPLIRLFTPKMETVWDVPFDGEPCIFVGNHDRANGPVSVAVKFPLKDQCHIWIYANAMERKLVPAYVRQDYWWDPESRLAPLYDKTIPYLTALALPPILKSVPNVPVYHDMRVMTTMRESLRLLEKGRSLIIFPGIPDGYKSHSDTKTSEGYLQLLPLYHKKTGKVLKIWPMHLDRHTFHVKAPIVFDPERPLKDQVPDLCRQVTEAIEEDE